MRSVPPEESTFKVYSSPFSSYPDGAFFSLTLYVPEVRKPEVTVPSDPVVRSNFDPSGRVTSNTASASVVDLFSASTFVNLILLAKSPVPDPPESAEI